MWYPLYDRFRINGGALCCSTLFFFSAFCIIEKPQNTNSHRVVIHEIVSCCNRSAPFRMLFC